MRQYDTAVDSSKQTSRLWASMMSKFVECEITLARLDDAVEKVRIDKSNILAQVLQQAWLSMNKDDIIDFKNRIKSHTTTLQISLQLINITVSHMAPNQADQTLLTKLDSS